MLRARAVLRGRPLVRRGATALPRAPQDARAPIRIRGGINFVLIAVIIAAILMSAIWKPGITFDIFGTHGRSCRISLRDAVADRHRARSRSWLTPNEHRETNGFTWEPIREVAILFAGIFVAIIPVLAMLQAGTARAVRLPARAGHRARTALPHEVAYFWLTGILSAFLDNAPTYLVFFELAGGDAAELMGPLAGTLAAISMGAVYMGALTYIGNAPNFMIYAIATEHGVTMPSFFGYLFWAALILVPLFVLLTLLPVSPMLRLANGRSATAAAAAHRCASCGPRRDASRARPASRRSR